MLAGSHDDVIVFYVAFAFCTQSRRNVNNNEQHILRKRYKSTAYRTFFSLLTPSQLPAPIFTHQRNLTSFTSTFSFRKFKPFESHRKSFASILCCFFPFTIHLSLKCFCLFFLRSFILSFLRTTRISSHTLILSLYGVHSKHALIALYQRNEHTVFT